MGTTTPPLVLSSALMFANPPCAVLFSLGQGRDEWADAVVLSTPLWDPENRKLNEPIDLEAEIPPLVAASFGFDPDRELRIEKVPDHISNSAKALLAVATRLRLEPGFAAESFPRLVAHMPALTALDATAQHVKLDISKFEGPWMATLQELSVGGCRDLRELTPLAPMVSLRKLQLRDYCRSLEEIATLSSLTKLQSVSITGRSLFMPVVPSEHFPLLASLKLSELEVRDCRALTDASVINSLLEIPSLSLLSPTLPALKVLLETATDDSAPSATRERAATALQNSRGFTGHVADVEGLAPLVTELLNRDDEDLVGAAAAAIASLSDVTDPDKVKATFSKQCVKRIAELLAAGTSTNTTRTLLRTIKNMFQWDVFHSKVALDAGVLQLFPSLVNHAESSVRKAVYDALVPLCAVGRLQTVIDAKLFSLLTSVDPSEVFAVKETALQACRAAVTSSPPDMDLAVKNGVLEGHLEVIMNADNDELRDNALDTVHEILEYGKYVDFECNPYAERWEAIGGVEAMRSLIAEGKAEYLEDEEDSDCESRMMEGCIPTQVEEISR